MSDVRFLPAEKMHSEGFRELLAPFRFSGKECKNNLVAVKIHPGEDGNSSYIPASLVKLVITALNLPERRTFLTDTTVLYGGRRMSAPDYVSLAHDHGFKMPELPPFIVADGLVGTDEFKVELPSSCETRVARLAGALAGIDSAVMISHFKGHLLAGFGGSIKHLGMGWASRAGKLFQHSSVMPSVKTDKCNMCGACVSACGSDAVKPVGVSMRIDDEKCTGCGECLQRCPSGAIGVTWNQEAHVFVKRMTEYALAASMAVKIPVYINFLLNISPDCDCMKKERPPMVNNIGVLASSDPVGIDQASLDLVTLAEPLGDNAASGHDKFLKIRPDRDGREQLVTGENLGLGSRVYRLVQI
jgi:uncharacterized Fe-S center protein